jgi:hypothetical protein
MKVAMVHTATHVVKNVIIVNSLNDTPPAGYHYAEMEIVETPIDPEVKALQDIIKEVDPLFKLVEPTHHERQIKLNVTKWTSERGFYED